jgi:hypothetical protein
LHYCSECGTKIEVATAKFCAECGTPIGGAVPLQEEGGYNNRSEHDLTGYIQETQAPDQQSSYANQNDAHSIYQRGVNLESMVENILRAEGYKTVRRERIPVANGSWRPEIDVWAEKNNSVLAVECKNKSSSSWVPISEVTHFNQKLDEIKRQYSRKTIRGLFVTSSHFSSDSERFADNHGIELWDYETITDKHMKVSLGRDPNQPIQLPLALPIVNDYDDVIKLNLVNQDLIAVKRVALLWNPFVKVDYDLNVVRKLPNRRNTFTLSKKSSFIYDAVNNEKVNSNFGLAAAADLESLSPHEEYPVQLEDSYHTERNSPKGQLGTLKKLVVRRVIELYTQDTSYTVHSSDGPRSRKFKIVPAQSEVLITNIQTIYVPKWSVFYEVGGIEYAKEALGCSETVISDQLEYCSKDHGMLDKLKRHDEGSFAICETCYRPFCKSHIVQFKERYYCKDHDVSPKPEKKRFGFLGKASQIATLKDL